ncbi:DUF479 domain-containing protein [Verrucomicrobiaceae bacterium N1E253]|uniref:DUF479 domain-containing protein n=1 Tax=Oceaniferula marina TaxID=2748318 RepID=A0A851GKD7_9BACT|nr:DUF479 domain-containing protein [Oceaniferula marina]
MNFLAHLLLADDSAASRIGNLLGDFARGPIEQHCASFPKEVVRGIQMHRFIDGFTDSHPAFLRCRRMIHPERRRFAGIMVDLFWDHFLSIHWKDYHASPLETFCQQIYSEMEDHPEWLAGRLGKMFPIMKRENWLMRYSTLEGMALTLEEVSHRSPRIRPIAKGMEDLTSNYEALDSQFQVFMPELLAFVHRWKINNPA